MNKKEEKSSSDTTDIDPKSNNTDIALDEHTIPFSSNIAQDILDCIEQMSTNIETLENIIQKSNFISLNAAIEAARSRTQTDNFTLVAEQVNRQAERMEEFSLSLKKNIRELKKAAISSIGTNLIFFSYCSSFLLHFMIDTLVNELIFLLRISMKFQNNNSDLKAQSSHINKKIKNFFIEFVRHKNESVIDIFVCDHDGNCAGDVQPYPDRFKEIFSEKSDDHIVLSDIYKDKYSSEYRIDLLVPVNIKNNCIYYIFTSINWSLITNIFNNFPYGESYDTEILDKDGNLIASRGMHALLKENFGWLTIGSIVLNEETGFSIEKARNGVTRIWGGYYDLNISNSFPCFTSMRLNLNANDFTYKTIIHNEINSNKAFIEANTLLAKLTKNNELSVKKNNSINRQTNLLAVNASIQAGIAGADGEAFSVVAGEIGKLATSSEEVISSINDISSALDIKVKTMNLTNIMMQGYKIFQEISRINHMFFRLLDYLSRRMSLSDNHAFSKALAIKIREESDHFLDIIFLDKNAYQIDNKEKDYSHVLNLIKDQAQYSYSKGVEYSEFNHPIYYLTIPVIGKTKKINGYVVGIASLEKFISIINENLKDPENKIISASLVNDKYEKLVSRQFSRKEDSEFSLEDFCLHLKKEKLNNRICLHQQFPARSALSHTSRAHSQ